MSALDLVRVIRRAGRIAEPASAATESDFMPPPALAGSAQVRHVDCGSCNGCEIELAGAFGPVYDAERFGARLVASPRHADVLAVTGAPTCNLAEPLRRSVDAAPQPRVVIAIGDCAAGVGAFAQGYAVVGAVSDVVPVDLVVPGCPPPPDAIVAALRQVTGR